MASNQHSAVTRVYELLAGKDTEEQIKELKKEKVNSQGWIKNYEEWIDDYLKDLADPRISVWMREDLKRNVQGCENRIQRYKLRIIHCDAELAKIEHKTAYEKILEKSLSVMLLLIRIVYVGLPRSGKTTTRLRLIGDIINIVMSGLLKEQPSTGVVEEGGQVFIRSLQSGVSEISSRAWSTTKNLLEEAHLLNGIFYQAANSISKNDPSQEEVKSTSPEASAVLLSKELAQTPTTKDTEKSKNLEQTENKTDIEEVFSAFQEAMEAKDLNQVEYLLEDIILLMNTDTGGQPEFLDLHAALIMGPSLYLLFHRLTDELESLFKIYYTNNKGESTEEEESTMTVEEVLFQALSGITCFSSSSANCSSPAPDMQAKHSSHSKSKAIFVGTHKDKVNDEELKKKNELLKKKIESTDCFKRGIIEYASEDQPILAVNNLSGDEQEIENIHKILEEIIRRCFKKVKVPITWLILSLSMRRKKWRTVSLKECEELAGKLGISRGELQSALWFLHHHLGLVLYYPKVEELKDTLICDVKILFDGITNLTKKTFVFGKVTPKARKLFREKAQFSLVDVMEATSDSTDDLLPVEKLVKLLDYLNILASMKTAEGVTYFMPSVLKCARGSELAVGLSSDDPAPLMLCYDCGYMPSGLFTFVMANLVSQISSQELKWRMFDSILRKNKIQFRVGEYNSLVTLVSRPTYLEMVISGTPISEAHTKSLCCHVREVVESTLMTVTSHLNYTFIMGYKFAFECPTHPGREHLCVKETSKCMFCPRNESSSALLPQHTIWFTDGAASLTGDVATTDDGDRVLGMADLGDVVFAAEALSPRWKELSLKLQLRPTALKIIEKNYPHDVVGCYCAALEEWLKLNYEHRKHGKPSWKKLAEAVRTMDGRVHEEIVKKYGGHVSS